MPKISAGLLMFRRRDTGLEFLLVHPGGPFWRSKDEGAWTIPKGELNEGEELLAAARREFEEETGCKPAGDFILLNPVKQKGGKIIHAWAFEGACDVSKIKSNTFEMQWPPKSKKRVEFPEIDRAAFFDLTNATMKINPAQVPLLHELIARQQALS